MSLNNDKGRFSYHAVRITLGIVYFHFGFLKLFPDLSPAELLASQTIVRLTGGLVGHDEALFWLAIMEVVIGTALLFNIFMRFTVVLFLLHMVGTFSPVILLPELAFKIFPFAPTLEGQYILKNLVFVAAGWGVLMPHVFADRQQPPVESNSSPGSTSENGTLISDLPVGREALITAFKPEKQLA